MKTISRLKVFQGVAVVLLTTSSVGIVMSWERINREVIHPARDAISDFRFSPIPELMTLPEGADIPEWIFEKYDSRTIGRTLVKRLEATRDKTQGTSEASYYDFYKDTSLRMVFPEAVIQGIIDRGFLNSHQVKGYENEPMVEPENMMIGLRLVANEKIITKVLETRPKYMYLNMDRPDSRIWKSRLDRRYGNVVAVFYDAVKRRATFTSGNSWVIREGAHSLSFKISKPFPEPDYEATFQEYREWGHHFEAQVWGELNTGDVSYFMINCPFFGQMEEENLQKLKGIGLPIYQCENDKENSSIIQGQRLF